MFEQKYYIFAGLIIALFLYNRNQSKPKNKSKEHFPMSEMECDAARIRQSRFAIRLPRDCENTAPKPPKPRRRQRSQYQVASRAVPAGWGKNLPDRFCIIDDKNVKSCHRNDFSYDNNDELPRDFTIIPSLDYSFRIFKRYPGARWELPNTVDFKKDVPILFKSLSGFKVSA